ncbi:TPA: DUF6630 family protein [Streptococcus suis]
MLTEENLQDIFEIADLLSEGNRDIFIQLKESVFASDPNHILDLLEGILSPEAFDAFLDRVGEVEKDNLLLILLALLEHNRYVCVRPRKDRLFDFIAAFDCLQPVRNAGILLKLDSAGLEETGNVPDWAAIIDEKYASEQFCLAAVEMNADQYHLLFGKVATLKRVQNLFANLGYRLDYAKNM